MRDRCRAGLHDNAGNRLIYGNIARGGEEVVPTEGGARLGIIDYRIACMVSDPEWVREVARPFGGVASVEVWVRPHAAAGWQHCMRAEVDRLIRVLKRV